jgi:hypothetical protein
MVIEHFPHRRLTFSLFLAQRPHRGVVIPGVSRHVGGHDNAQLCEPLHQRRSNIGDVLDHPSLIADWALAVGCFVGLQNRFESFVGRDVRRMPPTQAVELP